MIMIMFQDGMGNLQLSQDGIRLEGISEFLLPVYVNEIQSRRVSFLYYSHQLHVDQYSDSDELGIAPIDWKHMWKAFGKKELTKAADKLVLIT